MSRTLNRNNRLVAVLLGSFALSVLMPVVASAGSSQHVSHRDSHDGQRSGSHRDYRGHGSSAHRGHQRDYRHDAFNQHNRYSRYNRGHHKRSSYYCAPCDHGFNSRSDFHSHLSGHHYIAPWLIPFAIIQHTLGWIFYG